MGAQELCKWVGGAGLSPSELGCLLLQPDSVQQLVLWVLFVTVFHTTIEILSNAAAVYSDCFALARSPTPKCSAIVVAMVVGLSYFCGSECFR